MKLSQVKPIAEAVRSKLAPYCEECEIGGSVRRECPKKKIEKRMITC
jgi:hypothetical protein